MNVVNQLLLNGRCKLPLRVYHAFFSILTLMLCCLISCMAVILIDRIGGLSLGTASSLILCSVMTILLGSVLLAWEAGYYIRPAKIVVDAAGRIAKGDFSIRASLPELRVGISEGYVLVENFNYMAQELQCMDHMRKGFIGSVSHEFKTPLASMVGLTELLAEDDLTEEERKDYINLLHDEALRLSRLAENLLRLSRLDEQAIVTRKEIIIVDEQIRKCVILLADRWEAKDLNLSVELPDMEMEGDPDLTQQVWLNLIDNAIKYSGQGKNLVISGQASENCISVTIRDEGIGIPGEKQGHIFEPFYQCEESHKEQGHGLGLSIVKRIIELLNGAIECHSEVGTGTEMIVTLPKK